MAALSLRTGFLRVLLAIAMALAAAMAISFHFKHSGPLAFEQAVWNAKGHAIDDFRRHRMADWLVRRDRLVGMSRDQVIAMLGEPTASPRLRPYELAYALGRARSWMATHSEWLLIRFDSAGNVSAAELASDVYLLDPSPGDPARNPATNQ